MSSHYPILTNFRYGSHYLHLYHILSKCSLDRYPIIKSSTTSNVCDTIRLLESSSSYLQSGWKNEVPACLCRMKIKVGIVNYVLSFLEEMNKRSEKTIEKDKDKDKQSERNEVDIVEIYV